MMTEAPKTLGTPRAANPMQAVVVPLALMFLLAWTLLSSSKTLLFHVP